MPTANRLAGANVAEWEVRDLYFDAADRLWVGTQRHGLLRVDQPGTPQQQIVAYTTAEGLANNTIRCISADQAGRLYVGAGRGIDRLDPATGRIKYFDRRWAGAHLCERGLSRPRGRSVVWPATRVVALDA